MAWLLTCRHGILGTQLRYNFVKDSILHLSDESVYGILVT